MFSMFYLDDLDALKELLSSTCEPHNTSAYFECIGASIITEVNFLTCLPNWPNITTIDTLFYN